MSTPKVLHSYRFLLMLVIGIVIGSIIGWVLGPKAVALKPLGDLFLNLMFTIVVPLVFVTIAGAVASISSLGRLGRIMTVMIGVFVVTGIVSSVLTLTAVVAFPPASGVKLDLPAPEKVEPLKTASQIVAAFTVPDFRDLLSRRNVLPLIVFAILFGAACTKSGAKGRVVADMLDALSDVMVKLVGIVMYFAPIGLGGYFAWLVGEFGPSLFDSYARAMAVYYPLAIAYYFVFFTLYAFLAGGHEGVRRFWGNIMTPSVTSLATGSSVASIPANLLASARIGVSRDVRELVIPMGATVHMDGSCMSAILKIAFLFGFYNMPMHGLETYLTMIGVALLSGVVMAGIPGGGMIGELLIVQLYGFPPEALIILTVIGNLVDPVATMVNSTGDTVAGMMISRVLEGKKWLENAELHPE